MPSPSSPRTQRPQAPAIAAAADLKYALAETADAYRRGTGGDVRIAYGSSGNFTQQIEHGAPFELFLSADEAYVERLAAKGYTRDAGMLLRDRQGRAVRAPGSPLAADPALADLALAVRDGRVRRFAIAI